MDFHDFHVLCRIDLGLVPPLPVVPILFVVGGKPLAPRRVSLSPYQKGSYCPPMT